jgi:NAD(P)-dependent dehydrogenase (short-subunit alcohol dehydrogenase family)
MSLDLFDLEGRVAVVTGGAGVLGGTIAEGLVDAGAHVVIMDKDRDGSEATVSALRERSQGAKVRAIVTDVMDEEQLRSGRDETVATFGTVDILVNAAGGNVARARTDHTPVFGLPWDAFDEVLRLNLHGTVYPTLAFGEVMAKQGKGSIVNISSMAAGQYISGVVGYSAAKAGIDNFTRWMAVDVARRHGDGVRVNAIAPGFFVTKQNRDVLIKPDGSYTDRSAAIVDQTPAGRFGRPEEVVGPVLFFCSDAASFVTGTVLAIDGGFSAYSGV